jgi:hypothetical protein
MNGIVPAVYTDLMLVAKLIHMTAPNHKGKIAVE